MSLKVSRDQNVVFQNDTVRVVMIHFHMMRHVRSQRGKRLLLQMTTTRRMMVKPIVVQEIHGFGIVPRHPLHGLLGGRMCQIQRTIALGVSQLGQECHLNHMFQNEFATGYGSFCCGGGFRVLATKRRSLSGRDSCFFLQPNLWHSRIVLQVTADFVRRRRGPHTTFQQTRHKK